MRLPNVIMGWSISCDVNVNKINKTYNRVFESSELNIGHLSILALVFTNSNQPYSRGCVCVQWKWEVDNEIVRETANRPR